MAENQVPEYELKINLSQQGYPEWSRKLLSTIIFIGIFINKNTHLISPNVCPFFDNNLKFPISKPLGCSIGRVPFHFSDKLSLFRGNTPDWYNRVTELINRRLTLHMIKQTHDGYNLKMGCSIPQFELVKNQSTIFKYHASGTIICT